MWPVETSSTLPTAQERRAHGPDDRVEILEHAIELLAHAGERVALLQDRFLDAYVLPQLQGHEGGWLGEHAVDHLRNALHATRHPEAADA